MTAVAARKFNCPSKPFCQLTLVGKRPFMPVFHDRLCKLGHTALLLGLAFKLNLCWLVLLLLYALIAVISYHKRA